MIRVMSCFFTPSSTILLPSEDQPSTSPSTFDSDLHSAQSLLHNLNNQNEDNPNNCNNSDNNANNHSSTKSPPLSSLSLSSLYTLLNTRQSQYREIYKAEKEREGGQGSSIRHITQRESLVRCMEGIKEVEGWIRKREREGGNKGKSKEEVSK